MNQLPLVSILIPTYNRAKYLGAALDSALAQDYQNLEIIVHDDASSDHTPALLANYSDPRLQIIRTNKNHGMLGGWNYLVKRAKGEYIKFLASDDLLESNCVSTLVQSALAHPHASVITCRRQFIDEEGGGVRTMGFAAKDTLVNGKDYSHWLLTTMRENKIGEPTAVLYPVKIVKKAGEFDPTFSQFADLEYWLRLLAYGDLVYVNRSLCSFRLHASSGTTSAQKDGRFITETFALIKKYYDDPTYIKTFSLTNADRLQVTRQKTLDTLKNIKDLLVAGHLSRALTYSRHLSHEVSLGYMAKLTLSHLQ